MSQPSESASGEAAKPDGTSRSRPKFPIEEYKAALTREREIRDHAFFDLPVAVAGVDLRPMTLRQLVIRFNIGCPFMQQLPPDPRRPEDIASFLWHLSEDRYRTRFDAIAEYRARRDLCARVAEVPYLEAYQAIQDYIDQTFLDSPPSSGPSTRAPKTSIAATLVDIFSAQYGWTRDQVLDSPLVQLYQLLREMDLRKNPKAILFNRLSDRVRAKWSRDKAAWDAANKS